MKTAEEFLKDKFRKIYLSHPESFKDKISEKIYLELHVTGRVNGTEQNYPEMMIEFAKMHVQEALKQALENIPCLGSSTDIASYEEVEKAILNCYPLENIK